MKTMSNSPSVQSKKSSFSNDPMTKPAVIMSIIVFVGALLRIFYLGEKSFWVDELLSIWHAQNIVDIRTFLSANTGANAHPPLYFLILKGWLSMGEGEFYLRLLSVIFGILVIPATYCLGREFISQKASLIGAFIVSISPMLLLHDREVRMYPLFTLLSTLSLLFLVKAIKNSRIEYWLPYVVVTSLCTYTHYHSFLLIASQWFFVFFIYRKIQWREFLISQVAVALLFLPWLPSYFAHMTQYFGIGNMRFPITGAFFIKPFYLFFSFSLGQTVLPWTYWIVLPAAAFFIIAFVLGFNIIRKKKEAWVFFLVTLFIPILISLFFSEVMPRYMIFLAPLYYLVIGQGIAQLNKRVIQVVCLLIITVIMSYGLNNYYTNRDFHILASIDPWREVGTYLKENVQKNDIVFNIGGFPLRYYMGFNAAVLGKDALDVIKIEVNKKQFNRIWLIASITEYKQAGEDAIRWMNEHYTLISEKKYYKDKDFAIKARWFKKEFMEYRIRVFLYE